MSALSGGQEDVLRRPYHRVFGGRVRWIAFHVSVQGCLGCVGMGNISFFLDC